MIGNKVHDLRIKKHLTQTELSKILHVSQQTITKWENGKAEPSSSALAKISDYFNVSADYLLGKPEKNKSTVTDADLENMLDNAKSFDGKPMDDHDRELIRAYLKGLYENK
ncbi:helix-turn-helix domain-containing protein [Lactobacillus paragasseri]|uniref:Helix-turn-helix transcriptional regulator n=1 Tax=Lactobacillus paragasseri TaxID=2107999 RepID=A0ABD5A039_9LACO|nr:helix-turn-helix transcriptional regulator [Lactobacillus paragasseri]MDK7951637.1 helix-turn-helix transcriptional regulator [Lactobacillus paragasseri]MDO6361201.1 helix-turn-helix transcriptional regulator [Lactobacillus paragasseri]MDX5059692.1 helix-turn-helix transcriptional regulator [Lactobacillus paragasseri]